MGGRLLQACLLLNWLLLAIQGFPVFLDLKNMTTSCVILVRSWHIGPVLGFKEIPGIAYGHLLIYALRQLREKHTIEPGEVESVVVDTFYDAWIIAKTQAEDNRGGTVQCRVATSV